MYQIGMFSKINRITTKTLRHWDELDLLKPDRVDDYTGYRYYTTSQLPRVHRILTLKQMGLPLNEIKEMIDKNEGIDLYLRLRELELEVELTRTKQQMTQIKSYRKRIKGDSLMNYDPIIKSLPGVIVASMRVVIPEYETYFDIVPKMGEEMGRQKAVCALPAYCFTIYHDGEYKEKDIDVEVCESVVDFCEDSDMVKYKRIPPVKQAVCILHKGPYSTLREAYSFAFTWIRENKWETVGNPRESYIDGIWNKDDESEWLTELQIPVEGSCC
ncbi:MAG: MerR family transcriptional regulator [Spirochaetales bacterium]|nr:MerR family transcriptional regulator [Spirochaetales bacterium]